MGQLRRYVKQAECRSLFIQLLNSIPVYLFVVTILPCFYFNCTKVNSTVHFLFHLLTVNVILTEILNETSQNKTKKQNV